VFQYPYWVNFMAKGSPTIGIDIGSSLIKVVEARAGRDGINITAIGIGPTPPGTIDNEIIVDPQALGQALKSLLVESGITCKRCVSSVAGQSSVVVRIIEVPKMTRQELAETMKWEVERHVPFAADEVMLDFEPIERADANPDDQNMEVLLAVVQQEVVNSHIETLFAAGLQPAAIEVEPLAVCRSLIDASQDSLRESTVAIISIGAAVTELGVYRSSLLAFPRTLPIAGDAITRAISENLHIDEAEAERVKRDRGIVMLDRVQSAAQGFESLPAMGLGTPGSEGGGATVDLSGMGQQEDPMANFVPGLGFMSPEGPSGGPEPGPTAAIPDFDIDLPGVVPSAPKPVLDFDLSVDDIPEAHRPGALDLNEETPDTGEIDFSKLSTLSAVGHTDFGPEEVFDAMSSALMDLIAEIRRSLEYYSSRFQGQPDKILLCGGTAKLKDLDKLMENELGIPVVLANPLDNVTVFSRQLTEGYLAEVATVLPVSVGLAIRDMIGE
jgi:type IV pilus assembly protein PilM